MLSLHRSVGTIIGNGFNTFLGDRNKVEVVVGGTLAIAAGYMFAKRSITQAFNFLEARLSKYRGSKNCVLGSKFGPFDLQ